MLKAAFVTPGAFPIPSSMGGSVERVVEKVVPQLLPQVQPIIYGRLGGKLSARGSINGVPVERLPAADKARYYRQVCKKLKVFRPQIIQVENRPLWIPRLKRAFPNQRIGLNLHSTTFISLPYMNKQQRLRSLQAADYIQVNSEYLKAYISHHVPKVMSKITVNHLGVDVDKFPPRLSREGISLREELRTRKSWGNRPIVLYVGRLIPQKGVHHLLAALPRLIQYAPDVLVVMVGSAFYGSHRRTPYVRRLYAQAERWKKHVYFQPYVSHNQIPQWFAVADLAVVPSVGREAFGLVNLEAMAAELPVIATSAGGLKEIVVDGLTGFLVTPHYPSIVDELASRMQYLLTNSEARLEMGRRGRERVLDSFLWEHTAKRWLELQQGQQN